MLRSVSRIAHARGKVKLGELPKKEQKAYFDQIHDLGNVMPTTFLPLSSPIKHASLHLKLDKAREKFESSPFNWYSFSCRLMRSRVGPCPMQPDSRLWNASRWAGRSAWSSWRRSVGWARHLRFRTCPFLSRPLPSSLCGTCGGAVQPIHVQCPRTRLHCRGSPGAPVPASISPAFH